MLEEQIGFAILIPIRRADHLGVEVAETCRVQQDTGRHRRPVEDPHGQIPIRVLKDQVGLMFPP